MFEKRILAVSETTPRDVIAAWLVSVDGAIQLLCVRGSRPAVEEVEDNVTIEVLNVDEGSVDALIAAYRTSVPETRGRTILTCENVTPAEARMALQHLMDLVRSGTVPAFDPMDAEIARRVQTLCGKMVLSRQREHERRNGGGQGQGTPPAAPVEAPPPSQTKRRKG